MLTIRRGLPEDAQDFVKLFLLSSPYFPVVFGGRIVNVLERLFQRKKNLFSYEHTFFADFNGEKAGMLLGYDWKAKRRENIQTGLMISRFSGCDFFAKVNTYLKFNRAVGRLEAEEYYISNIATYENFRGKGVGKALMGSAEEEAQKCGCRKVVLDVEEENLYAIAFYKKLGFNEQERFLINLSKGLEFHFFRMVKLL